MIGFVARWLADAVRLGLALTFAVTLMQVPALTHEYAVGLRQVTEDARRDIDQRKASAQEFYHLTADSDEAVVAALQSREPSNAQTLAKSIDRVRVLRAAYDHLTAAPSLLQPLTAALDTIADPQGYRRLVLETALGTYVPQLLLSAAAAIYGLAGLVMGSFVAQLLLSAAGGLVRSRSLSNRGGTSARDLAS